MLVIVGSTNPVKVRAVQRAFATVFAPDALEVRGVTAASKVPDQPMGDAQTLLGARNRVADARHHVPGADFYVAPEGGIDCIGTHEFAFAWLVAEDKNGRESIGRSMTLPLPETIMSKVHAGVELGIAFDQVFGTENSKHNDGAFGVITGGLHTRESIYYDTLCSSLMLFKNKEFS
ncbi:inosine/xanthosine triphosphatase [Polycladidibacter hongkongensis]|uniref:inosine/xanthosine triphosphatase n=1 Tax=Polycladidibacter hongkongensis TaxID=1647556 RepID=UPI0008351A2E|nr:inosine/xanthosine triphosphatase [Pseudovibrio hongkongensis]